MFASFIIVELSIMVAIILITNLMKHWTLLLLPNILKSQFSIGPDEMVFYIMACYTAYYYGMMAGTWFWNKVEENFSSQASILVSMIALGLSNFLQSQSGNVKKFIVIRFLTGFSCNINKIGTSYVHELIPKQHRKAAFFINSGSNLVGTVAGPFVGEFLVGKTQQYTIACLVITMVCFIVAISNVFVFIQRDTEKGEVKEETVVLFKRYPSMVRFSTKEFIISCFWTNQTSRRLIICFVLNSCCIQSDFVLTSLLFTNSYHQGDFVVTNSVLAYCDFISAISGLFALGLINLIVPSLIPYKTYFLMIISYCAFGTLITPFMKINFVDNENRMMIFKIFYVLKYSICYYLYTNLLKYFINLAIFKPYRKPLNLLLGTIKSFFDGSIFNLLIPLLYLSSKNEFTFGQKLMQFGIPFLIIGVLQFATIILMFSFKIPRPETYMED